MFCFALLSLLHVHIYELLVVQMVSQQRYLNHEEAQHRRVLGEYKELLENHVKLREDTTKVCRLSDLWEVIASTTC